MFKAKPASVRLVVGRRIIRVMYCLPGDDDEGDSTKQPKGGGRRESISCMKTPFQRPRCVAQATKALPRDTKQKDKNRNITLKSGQASSPFIHLF